MTPTERLSKSLPDETLIHEIGHVIIGFELQLTEGGIEFTENDPNEIARAHYNLNGAKADEVIMRGLAGMYCQALCCPNSIVEPLRSKILRAKLFVAGACLTNNPPEVAAIMSQGFVGDWNRVIDAAQSNTPTAEKALVLLQKAHKELLNLAKTVKLRKLAAMVLQDVKEWMNTDDPDLDLSPMIFYHVERAMSVWKKAKDHV